MTKTIATTWIPGGGTGVTTSEPDTTSDDGVLDINLLAAATEIGFGTGLQSIKSCWMSGGVEVCETTLSVAGERNAQTIARHELNCLSRLAVDPIDPL